MKCLSSNNISEWDLPIVVFANSYHRFGSNQSATTTHTASTNALDDFYHYYSSIHRYLAATVACIGFLSSVCSVVVLSRPQMRSTVNVLLISVAVCDACVMVTHFTYLAHYRLLIDEDSLRCFSTRHSFAWALYSLVYVNLSVLARALSLWLSVTIAYVRQRALASPAVTMGTNKRLLFYVFFFNLTFVLLSNIPTYLTYTVRQMYYIMRPTSANNKKGNFRQPCPLLMYQVSTSRLASSHHCLLLRVSLWVHGCAHKLAPCVVLTVFIIIIVRKLRRSQSRHERIFRNSGFATTVAENGSAIGGVEETGGGAKELKPVSIAQALRRSTPLLIFPNGLATLAKGACFLPADRTLIAILLVTLITELPHACIAVLSGLLIDHFGERVYRNFGDLFDLLALLHSTLTFTMYCSTSKQFRDTLADMFCCCSAGLFCCSSDRISSRTTRNKATPPEERFPMLLDRRHSHSQQALPTTVCATGKLSLRPIKSSPILLHQVFRN